MDTIDFPVSKQKETVIDKLIDALFVDDFNLIIEKYTNTELDFQTIVLFIKLYMMAYRVTSDHTITFGKLKSKDDQQKLKIKELIHYAIRDSNTRKEIVKSFNDGTIIKTFFDQITKKLQ